MSKPKCPAHEKSRENLKKRGFRIWTVEHYNAFIKRKKDLYGFLDIVGLNTEQNGVLGVQATSKGNLSTRIKKAENLDDYWLWLACGNPVEFHGWYKPKHKWEVKIIRVEPTSLLG